LLLGAAAQINPAAHCVHFHTPRRIAYMRPQRMPTLLLDNHRDTGANPSRRRFRRQQETGIMGHIDLHRSRYGLQVPQPVARRIPRDIDRSGNQVHFQIIVRALDFHRPARRRRFHSIPRLLNPNGTLSRGSLDVSLCSLHRDIARRAVHAHKPTNIRNLDRPAGRRNLHVLLYAVDVHISGR